MIGEEQIDHSATKGFYAVKTPTISEMVRGFLIQVMWCRHAASMRKSREIGSLKSREFCAWKTFFVPRFGYAQNDFDESPSATTQILGTRWAKSFYRSSAPTLALIALDAFDDFHPPAR
jgi:hypothetical protein